VQDDNNTGVYYVSTAVVDQWIDDAASRIFHMQVLVCPRFYAPSDVLFICARVLTSSAVTLPSLFQLFSPTIALLLSYASSIFYSPWA
jgi:hypothetical protein